MLGCKKFENDFENFSLYLHGYWLPYLEQMMEDELLEEGKATSILSELILLRIGTAIFKIDGFNVYYKGLIDVDGEAVGYGVATHESGKNLDYCIVSKNLAKFTTIRQVVNNSSDHDSLMLEIQDPSLHDQNFVRVGLRYLQIPMEPGF